MYCNLTRRNMCSCNVLYTSRLHIQVLTAHHVRLDITTHCRKRAAQSQLDNLPQQGMQ
jgi:hypothetical protein